MSSTASLTSSLGLITTRYTLLPDPMSLKIPAPMASLSCLPSSSLMSGTHLPMIMIMERIKYKSSYLLSHTDMAVSEPEPMVQLSRTSGIQFFLTAISTHVDLGIRKHIHRHYKKDIQYLSTPKDDPILEYDSTDSSSCLCHLRWDMRHTPSGQGRHSSCSSQS